ncbi:MAG: putative rane-associated protein [Parcubacteria group bacterium]|nr:putative rane-associated protein [Parcubacteria group bacterium]
MPPLSALSPLITSYGYFLLFPLAVVEGPIVTVIAALLASQGYLNVFFVYLTVVAADLAGDLLFYSLGRWNASLVRRHGHWIGLTEERLAKADVYHSKHRRKFLVFSKTVHGIGVAGLVTAGILKMPYWKYFRTCLWVSLVQCAVFTLIGYFLGGAYATVHTYLNVLAAFGVVAAVLVAAGVFIYKKSQ